MSGRETLACIWKSAAVYSSCISLGMSNLFRRFGVPLCHDIKNCVVICVRSIPLRCPCYFSGVTMVDLGKSTTSSMILRLHLSLQMDPALHRSPRDLYLSGRDPRLCRALLCLSEYNTDRCLHTATSVYHTLPLLWSALREIRGMLLKRTCYNRTEQMPWAE